MGPGGFDALVAEHRGWLLHLCERRLGGDRHLAEDVVQETFVKLNRSLERGDVITNVRSWLRTVAQNGTVDELRRTRSVVLAELPERVVQTSFAADGDPELEVAWRGLSPRHREVLQLREIDGLRYDEIAAAMATGVSAVETLLFRARAALRREYSRAAATVTATVPAQAGLGPLRPSRWQELWQRATDSLHGGDLRLAGLIERVQATASTALDHATQLAAGAVLLGGAAAGLLGDVPTEVPPIVPPAISSPVPTTVPDVPTVPAMPATPTVPAAPAAPPVPPPAPEAEQPPALAEAVEPLAVLVDELVSGLTEPVPVLVEEIADLTARFR